MISIALTTYNGEQFISEQIDSILNQTWTDFELIICDDCSNDSTFEILKKYAQIDHRIKVFKNEKNLGFLKNFEKAILLCSGEYIALSDQDDIWLDNHLEVLINNIANYSLIGGNAILVDSNNSELGITLLQSLPVDYIPESQTDFEFHLLHENFLQGAAILFKKDLVEKALPFPQGIKFHDWWLSLVACSDKGITYIDTPILRYRQHSSNVTTNEKYNLINKVKKALINSKACYVYKEHKINVLRLLSAYKKLSKNPKIVENAKILESGNKILAALYLIRNRKLILLTNSLKVLLGKIGKVLFL